MAKFKEENIIYKLLTIGLIAGLIFFIYRVVYSCVIAADYPSELLEASNVALTRMFANHTSPYGLDSLNYEMPAVNYEYPFLGSVLALLVSKLNGGNIVTAHYIVSFLAFIGTGILGYAIVRPYSKTTAAPFAAAFLFLLCHWRFGFISAAPDDLGLFLFTLTLTMAVSPKIKHKPLVCALMTQVCFYTKQYFVFVAVGIFVYMLLYSKKEALKFLAYTVTATAAIGAVIMLVWPLYFTYTFYFLYFGCATGTGFGLGSLLGQIKYLLAMFAGFFIVLAIALGYYLYKRKKAGKSGEKFVIKVSENDPKALFTVMIPAMIIPLVIFGRNDGAFLSYFLQMWMPSIIVVTFISLENMKESSDKLIFDIFYGGVVAFTVLLGYLKLPLHTLTDEEIANWEEAYAIADEYAQEGDVYYCQQMAYLAFKNDAKYYYCGHDGEVSTQTLAQWESSKLSQILFPYADDIMHKNMDYQVMVTTKSFNKELKLLTFENGNSLFFNEEFIDMGDKYTRLKRIPLQLGNMEYTVSFYTVNE